MKEKPPDRFEVVRELGSGALGRILLAKDRRENGKLVALKILRADVGQAGITYLSREFQVLRRLDHPGLAKAIDLIIDPNSGNAYLAQEFIEGKNFLEGSRNADADALFRWGLAVSRTLAYLHARGVLHGDLKPENVLISKNGPVLIDFGLASIGSSKRDGLSGTPAYLAPEALRGAAPSQRTDLYALGVLLYQALSGKLPYPAENAGDLLIQILSLSPVPIRNLLPELDREQAAVIDRLIEKDPTRRYQAAIGVARDISRILKEPLDEKPRASAFIPFIDREDEIERAKKWLIGSLAEGAGSLVIHGPRGMGSSRLLREVCDYARTRGAMVAELTGRAIALHESFFALIEGFSGEKIDVPPLAKGADEKAAQLHKYKLWQAVGDALALAAKRAPLLVAIDDFEESSDSAFELTRYLVTRFRDEKGPLFLAAESDSRKPVPWSDELKPAPLSASAAVEFAAEIWGEKPADDIAEKLVNLSGGNPLFLREILMSIPPGADPAQVKAPESLDAMFTTALSRLDSDDIRLMETLSVWGGRASSDDLAALLETGSSDDVYSSLRKLEEQGLVSRHDGSFDVAWPFLARHVAESMAIGARRKIHARAADLLIQKSAAPLEEKIAHHFLEAGDCNAGATWALKAGQRLQSAGAHAELADLYRRALDLLDEADPRKNTFLEMFARSASISGLISAALAAWRQRIERAENDAPAVVASFHLEMARCQQRKGEYDRAERAINRAEEAVAKSGAQNDATSSARDVWETRALVNLARGQYEAAKNAAEKGMRIAGSAKPQAGPFLVALGLAQTYTGDYDAAVKSFESALEMFRVENDLPRQVLVLSSMGVALQHRGNSDDALGRYNEAFSLAKNIGDLRAQATLAMNIASVHHQRADYGAAVTEYRRALALARQIGADADVTRIENNLGNLLVYLGRPEQARALIDDSLSIAQRLGMKPIEGYDHLLRGDILKGRGEMMGARKEYLRARRILDGIGAARELAQVDLRMASLYTDMGERERAIASANEAIEAARRLNLRPFEAEAYLHLARLALKTGRADEALERARSAASMSEGAAPGLAWEIHAVIGSALIKLGKGEDAKKELDNAHDIAISLRDSLPEEYRDAFLDGSWWEDLKSDMQRATSAGVADSGPGERWEKLLEINRQLNLEHDLTRLLELIMDSVLMLIHAERGFLIINREGKLEVPVARNIDRESIGKAKHKISRSIAEEVFKTGTPLITVDAQQDERFDRFASVHDLKLRSVLCIPLRVKERVVGTLYVDNRFQSGAFSQDDLKVMEAFADQAAIAIENARLIEEDELKRRKLEASNRRIQSLVEELEQKVDRQTHEIASLQSSLDLLPQGPSKYDYAQIVGQSRVMRSVFSLMDRVTDSKAPVLIEGESGTGKELVARAIHFNGPRKAMRFLSENCSAIPETLLESELFGYEKGAFTGATERKIGLFEAADGGTIFLDEIGDMSLNMQSKLLRVLQEGQMRRVGSEKEIRVDVRVISATHQRLEDLIRQGRFREDLYWRLNVVKIALPPLRDRRDDIPLLVEHFTHILKDEVGRDVGIAPETMRTFMAYDWPGNVRELENELKKAALMSEGTVRPGDLSPRIIGADRELSLHKAEEELVTGSTLKGAVDEFEKRYLEQVIDECGGNRAKAAKKLGIARRTLYDKLSRYGLDEQDE